METCLLSPFVLLAIISTAFLSDDISYDKDVTGYLGTDVVLRCELLNGNLTQMEWRLVKPEGTVLLAVFSPQYGINISNETTTKGRLMFSGSTMDFSLIIKDVKKNDTGKYICEVTTFPGGKCEGIITLTVLDHPRHLPPGVVIGIVTTVLLLVVTMTAVTYYVIVKKRQEALFNSSDARVHAFNTDRTRTGSDLELVYSDIARFRIANNKTSNPPRDHQKNAKDAPCEEVTYAAVAVGNQHPIKEDIVYSVVKKNQDVDTDWIV
ncbi:hypothetical protein DPEC_G00144400 [Dallia pectoralis]|uniref:Uncharacterized protein n=1 Tax=Dallia pectoralis TaxID=75939 RepID=A0ACC2GNM5_DALPE|nr:hypothetical protein DPEC_G00144400 [Dallia pectoralis]